MSGQTDLKAFQKKLDYVFREEKYLTIALTHSSYANEGKKEDPCNERQEFLGDAVLSIIVSDYLFRHYSHLPEGELTKLRAAASFDFGRRFRGGDRRCLFRRRDGGGQKACSALYGAGNGKPHDGGV